MWHQSIFGTQLPHVGSDWLRHRSTTLSPGALQLTNTFGVVLRQVRQSFAKPCRTRLPQNHTAHTPRPNRTGYEVPEIAVAIMVENIRCDTTRCTNESLQPIHHTREWDQTWAEPEHRVVMGMGFRRGNSGQASPGWWCAATAVDGECAATVVGGDDFSRGNLGRANQSCHLLWHCPAFDARSPQSTLPRYFSCIFNIPDDTFPVSSTSLSWPRIES